MQQTEKVLTNGLRTLFVNSPGSKASSVQIWFRAGSALESKEDFGIAHFLEHMFFKGTEKRPGVAMAHEIESFGGEVNAFTSFDYTCYYINTPSTQLNKTVEILLDMVSNPTFKNEELIPERHVVHEEFRRSLDNPNQFSFKELQKSAFTKGYAHQILGTEKNILSFTREQLTKFREKFYNLSNALLIIAGDIKDQSKLESLVNEFKMPKGPKSSFPKFRLKNKASINIHSSHVNQSTLTMVIQAPNYLDKEGASEDLAINCMAHGEISPFYRELVTNTSIASYVSGSTMFFSDGGSHFLKIAFPTENFKQVLNIFKKTLKNSLKEGFQEQEVSRIKNQYIASKIYEKESIESHSFVLGHGFAQNGDINCEEEFVQNMKNVTLEEVNFSLRNIFSRDVHFTLQHPEEEKIPNAKAELEKLSKEIKFKSPQAKPAEQVKLLTSSFDPEVKLIPITKGVQLLYRQNKMTPTFVLHAYLKGGLSHESEASNGQYYYLSRLMTYGYKKVPFTEMKSDLENKSSYLNGFSGKNAYGLTLHGLSENFEALLEHFKGSLLEPAIPTNFLKLEKELVRRTIENQKEDPIKQCFREVVQTVFNQHPYSRPNFGTEKSIKTVSRKKLIELHQSRLQESDILLSYCGDEDLDTVKNKLKDILSSFKARKPNKKNKNKLKPLFNKKVKIPFEREQTQIFIGRPSYKTDQVEDLHLKMLTSFLGGQSSELFVEVRDRQGLCYSVQPIQHTALEAGYWGIYIGAGADKTEDAKKAILNILDRIKKKGIPKKEFERVKKMIDGQNQMSVQTNDDYANFYSIPVLHDLGLDYQHKAFQKIRDIKHQDFNKFLAKFLDTKWNIIEAGK